MKSVSACWMRRSPHSAWDRRRRKSALFHSKLTLKPMPKLGLKPLTIAWRYVSNNLWPSNHLKGKKPRFSILFDIHKHTQRRKWKKPFEMGKNWQEMTFCFVSSTTMRFVDTIFALNFFFFLFMNAIFPIHDDSIHTIFLLPLDLSLSLSLSTNGNIAHARYCCQVWTWRL